MRENTENSEITSIDSALPVTAARPLHDFAAEQVGDDLILFDGETMQYHTLNSIAVSIWRSCDGSATVETIAYSTGLPAGVVEITIAELEEASLLQIPSPAWGISISRRRAAKVIAAGVAGAVGVPVILSLTAPSHQAAATILQGCIPNYPCTVHNEQCDSGVPYGMLTCCYWGGKYDLRTQSEVESQGCPVKP